MGALPTAASREEGADAGDAPAGIVDRLALGRKQLVELCVLDRGGHPPVGGVVGGAELAVRVSRKSANMPRLRFASLYYNLQGCTLTNWSYVTNMT